MSKDYSATWNRTTNALSADEFPLICLEIEHDDLLIPIRIVNDRQPITVQGDLYQEFAFNISLPDDPEQGLPQAQLSIDNIGRDLVEWLDIADWNKKATCRIIQVLRSAPNTIEWEITTDLHTVMIDSYTVQATLGFDHLLGTPGVAIYYTPITSPGLF